MKWIFSIVLSLIATPIYSACFSLPITDTFLYTYNDLSSNTEYVSPVNIPFNGPTTSSGTGISHPTDDDIVFTRTGSYLVTFVGSTFASQALTVDKLNDSQYTAQVQFFLNGSGVGDVIEPTILGSTVKQQAIINVTTVPSVLNVRVIKATLWLNEGNSGTLNVVRISP